MLIVALAQWHQIFRGRKKHPVQRKMINWHNQGEYAAVSTNANDIFGTPADGRFTFPVMEGQSMRIT